MPGRVPDSHLISEPVVAWGGWVPFVEFAELVQTAQGEVVEGLFGPFLPVRVVEPFHEVEDAPALFDGAHHFLDVVLLALLDVICLAENLGWIRRFSVFGSSVGFDK